MRLVLLCLAAALLTGCEAQENTRNRDTPSGPVVDSADILSPTQEAKLDQELRDYFKRTGNALVVTSVTTLDGRPIEEVSKAIARRWGIGDPKTQKGLLIMVAPNERKVRIDVACGLESVITDQRAKQIIDNDILPLYRHGKMGTGTIAGAEELMRATDTYVADLGKPAHSPGCFKKAA